MSGISTNSFQPKLNNQLNVQNNTEKVTVNEEKKGLNKGAKIAIASGLTALAAVGIYLATRKSPKNILKSFDKPLSELGLTKTPEKVKNAGNTVEETIKNVFGEAETKIKPHTYDVSKEFDTIPTYCNCGGYKDSWATREGTFQFSQMTADLHPGQTVRSTAIAYDPTMKNGVSVGNKYFTVTEGYVPGSSNRVVKMTINRPGKVDCSDNPIPDVVSFISPNGELTPLQQDVLKLGKNCDAVGEEVASRFDRILSWRLEDWIRQGRSYTREEMFKNSFIHDSLDYDLILSTIQSLVK